MAHALRVAGSYAHFVDVCVFFHEMCPLAGLKEEMSWEEDVRRKFTSFILCLIYL